MIEDYEPSDKAARGPSFVHILTPLFQAIGKEMIMSMKNMAK